MFLHREAGSDGEIVKVLDFGLCKPMGDNEMLTTPGGMLGSPAYMAPEQIVGVSDIDPRTDIWALGVLAFEMFTGKRPFQGRGPDLIHAVLKDPIPRLRDVIPTIDPDLDEVVAGCIVRDRNQRFAHAADIVSRLEVLADRPDRNDAREPMPSVDEESDLGVTQVYRAGSSAPVQPYAHVGKTIPMMSATNLNPQHRPAPPTSDSGPSSGPAQGQPMRPSWPSSAPTPQSQATPPKLQTFGGAGPQGTAVLQHMPDGSLAPWQGQPQNAMRVSSAQNPAFGPPFPPAENRPAGQLRPWVAVALGVGIGLLALLAIIVVISLSQKTPPEPGAAPATSTGR